MPSGWASVGKSTAVYPMVMSIGFNPFYGNKVQHPATASNTSTCPAAQLITAEAPLQNAGFHFGATYGHQV